MPVSGLYTIQILENNPGNIVAEVSIDPAHSLFNGHFPGAPVLPGVIQLDMVKNALSEALGRTIALKELVTCKFLEVLNPQATPQMTLTISYRGEEAVDVTAAGSHGPSTYFKLRASYR